MHLYNIGLMEDRMENIIYIAIFVLGTAYFLKRALYYTHMFQLNSYRYARFFRFIKSNIQKILSLKNSIFIGLILLLSISGIHLGVVFMLAIRLIYDVKTKQQTKKPLAYTARVKRMISIQVILYSGLVILMYQFNADLLIFATIIFMSLPILLVANMVLIPWEKMMKNYYYKDAKKRLSEHSTLKIIGITGSYGKTSTKFILEKILSKEFNTLVTPHSYNTLLGVIITIRNMLRRSHEVFVVEMGAKQKGDIEEICRLVNPDYGIITAVGPQHLETFGSVDTVIDTKFELAQSVASKGICYVNGDNKNVRIGIERYSNPQYVTYGSDEDNQVVIRHIRQDASGSEFEVGINHQMYRFQTRLLGDHNMLNIAGAVAIAIELGVPYEKIYAGVKELKPVEHRLELKAQGDYFILDDAFNSNPTGAKSALDVLARFENGRHIIMTPGMIELGAMDDELHIAFGQQIAEVCDEVILIGEKKTKSIVAGLQAKNYPMDQVHICQTVFEGFNKIRELVQTGDVVLIENDLPDNFDE